MDLDDALFKRISEIAQSLDSAVKRVEPGMTRTQRRLAFEEMRPRAEELTLIIQLGLRP